MKKLIAFYSRADENYFDDGIKSVKVGSTEKVAEKMAELLGADLFHIEQKEPYAADYYECVKQAREDKANHARPELVSLPDLSQYDEVYLGYPNYCGTMPMAVYTFLESFEWSGKTIHPFCTHEGSGLAKTEKEIAQAAKGAKVTKGLAVSGSNLPSSKIKIENWAKA
ncbi:MAG: flavodoxin [Erysipelotrichaceae bacterium]|nr:flavodoxin [Erysipelotrichaceae bacterium]